MTIATLGDIVSYDAGLAGSVKESAVGVVPMVPGNANPLGTANNPMQVAGNAASNSASAGIYRRSAAVSATAGDGVIVTGVTTAGTINLTLQNGGSLVVNVPLGSTILPLGVTAATLGTAVGGTFQSLFFT